MLKKIIRIPVFPHVWQYLNIQYGYCVSSSEKNYIGVLISSLLKKPKTAEQIWYPPKLDFGATFDILISEQNAKHLGTFLSAEDIKNFSIAVDLLIRQEMFRWCEHPNAPDSKIDFNIRRFLAYYGFAEDELPFENMKRWFFRERIRLNSRLNPKINHEPQLVFDFFKERRAPNPIVRPSLNHDSKKQLQLFSEKNLPENPSTWAFRQGMNGSH